MKEDRNPLFAVAADGALTQARSERQWAGGRATVGITGGKHYYEATVQDDGLVRVAGALKIDRMYCPSTLFAFPR